MNGAWSSSHIYLCEFGVVFGPEFGVKLESILAKKSILFVKLWFVLWNVKSDWSDVRDGIGGSDLVVKWWRPNGVLKNTVVLSLRFLKLYSIVFKHLTHLWNCITQICSDVYVTIWITLHSNRCVLHFALNRTTLLTST